MLQLRRSPLNLQCSPFSPLAYNHYPLTANGFSATSFSSLLIHRKSAKTRKTSVATLNHPIKFTRRKNKNKYTHKLIYEGGITKEILHDINGTPKTPRDNYYTLAFTAGFRKEACCFAVQKNFCVLH